MRRRFSKADHDTLTALIQRAESSTSVEFVVEVVRHSGSYRDVSYLFGAVGAFLFLLFALFSPLHVEEFFLVIEYVIVFLGLVFVSEQSGLPARLTSSKRRGQQVALSAAAAFYSSGVTRTRQRTGVLIYCSALEKRIEVLRDIKVENAIPKMVWNEFEADLFEKTRAFNALENVSYVLQKLSVLAAEYLPGQNNDVDELSNSPRMT